MLKTHLIAITGNMFRNLFQFYTEMDYVYPIFEKINGIKKFIDWDLWERGVINQSKKGGLSWRISTLCYQKGKGRLSLC